MDIKERRRQGWIAAKRDSSDEKSEEVVAASVVPPSERERAEAMGGAAEWVRAEYDVDPAGYGSEHALMAAMAASEEGED